MIYVVWKFNYVFSLQGNGMKKSFFIVCLMFLLTGCADNVPYEIKQFIEPVGFWYGWWHGMIIPISWICSLFSDNISIYAAYNNGGWYNFGFILGIGALRTSSIARKK